MESRVNRRQIIATTVSVAGSISLAITHADATPATPAVTSAALPDTPVGMQLQWFIDVVNGVLPVPDETGVRQHFAQVFLDQVSVEQTIDLMRQLANQFAPVSVVQIGGYPTPLALDALVSTKGGDQYIVSISVEDNPEHRINGLLFTPFVQEPLATPTFDTWEDLSLAIISSGQTGAVHAEELTAEGGQRYIEETNPHSVLAIGSVFKLYVLGALATKIEQGELAWDQELVVTDSVKSLPSGVTQNEPTGTKLTIEELAKRMISISDNTAADMLIAAVTREACEAALVTQGNQHPERTIPFLTTREMFQLKVGDDPALLQQYIDADLAGRREIIAMLDEMPLPSISAAVAANTPVAIDEVEWFATAPDMSAAIAWLWARSAEPGLEPIAQILTINSGVTYDESIWKQVAFKGGSELGVLALCWLLVRSDGRTFTLTCGVNDPEKALEEEKIVTTVAAAFHLLAETP